MNRLNQTYHHLEPMHEDSCMESHVILSPPYVDHVNENEYEYGVFKIFEKAGDFLYVADDQDQGIYLRLEAMYTEIDEFIPVLNHDPNDKMKLLNLTVYKVMKNLPSIVAVERLERFPNEVLFAGLDQYSINQEGEGNGQTYDDLGPSHLTSKGV